MPKGYLIARVTVEDEEAYKLYAQGTLAAAEKYGARALVRGGRSEALEGEARPRNVVLEFATYDLAKAYFQSAEYQAARRHRLGKSVGEFVVVEGVD